jgi:hypothetical protein
MVNVLLPLQVADSSGGTTGYFALGHWTLPRVPTIGEELEVLQYRAKVERVTWYRDGRMTVRLKEARATVEMLEALDRYGWQTEPWQDEPPTEWLED